MGEQREVCPNIEDHTSCPSGFLDWHKWATKLKKTHRQRKCQGCGLYLIWEPKPSRLSPTGDV